ncbi:recombinase family protein [Arthrobacter sp. ISL-65]|uniref:recombinase family protein n=1 Tax=Arthrobacter sp. ISL-65 TaxID=2819112 RepID=UPI001BE556F0|nr:recombinase family protein [Arthrobacter sp. ISL-65]MBT2549802.1 recombinase family protein [Arthrobacter sp. ISL-65]
MSSRTAFIYCRISDDKTGARLGVQRQEEDCRELAEAKGYTVVRVFTDNDLSAYSGKARPAYSAMLKRVAAGEVDAVLCWHFDRLNRRPVELEAYIDACKAGGALTHSVKAGEMDLSTDSGQLVARMLGAAARYESDMKATRIRRASEQATRAGKWTGGTRPFGWTITDGVPELESDESEALADACARVLRGDSLGSIIRDFDDRGIKTTLGNAWSYATLGQALKRPRNAGLAALRGDIVGPSTFPAIVSENVWRGVCAVLDDPSRRRSQSNKAVHLLAGIAQCYCGGYVRSATVTTRNGEKHRIYRCAVRGSGHVSKRIEFVDHVVNAAIVAVRAAQDRAKTEDTGTDLEAERLELEATALRKRQEEAAVQAALGQIPMHMLGTVNAAIEKELSAITAEMAKREEAASRRPPAQDQIVTIPADSPYASEWASMHIDDRRDYLRSICNVILLPHGKGSTKVFNPDTVQVVVKAPGEGPGPMGAQDLARTAAVAASLESAGRGTYVSFHVGGEVVNYRVGEVPAGTSHEDDMLQLLEPMTDRGEALLHGARDFVGESTL